MDADTHHRTKVPAAFAIDILHALDVGAGVGLVITDPTLPDNPIIHVNEEFLAITGYEQGEVVGHNPRFLQGPESDRSAVEHLREAVAEGRAISIQLINYRKSGEPFSMNIDIRPIHDSNGGLRYFVGTLTDESARLATLAALREREQDLAEALHRLERIGRARMHFFAAASHDLRQPMQALALFAVALEKYALQPEMQTILSSMKASLKSMEEMFNTLLDISRLDAGILEPKCRNFFLNDLFQQLEDEFQPQAARAGLRLDVVPSSRAIHSDPQLLLRILRNFLSNALRYTSHGRIVLGARRQGEDLSIQVWDSGPGIPENRRLAIFQDFYQGEFSAADQKGGGLGLGLAIVKRLALVLGHALDVQSQVGKGTMFSIKVPLAEDEIAIASCPESRMVGEKCCADIAGAVVAVIEDDPDISDALEILLEEWGCVPVIGASVEGILARLQKDDLRPGVVLADFHLHGREQGRLALDDMRGRYGDIPAFLFTGVSGAQMEATEQAPYPILQKPLNPDRLREILTWSLTR